MEIWATSKCTQIVVKYVGKNQKMQESFISPFLTIQNLVILCLVQIHSPYISVLYVLMRVPQIWVVASTNPRITRMQQRHNGCRCRLGNTPRISSIPESHCTVCNSYCTWGLLEWRCEEEILTLYTRSARRRYFMQYLWDWIKFKAGRCCGLLH